MPRFQIRTDDETEFAIKKSAKAHGTTKSAETRNLITEAIERRAFAERLLARIQEEHFQFEEKFFQRLSDTQRAFEERILAAIEAALKPEHIEQLVATVIDKKHELFSGF